MKIEAKNVTFKINDKIILNGVSCEIDSGKLIAIVGLSGSGKTTLLNCLSLLQNVTSGKICIDNEDTTKWNESKKSKFWNKHASFIYQDYGVIEDSSVLYNVTLKKSNKNLNEVQKVLDKVGLSGRDKELGISLSGGEKQRLAIARALYKNSDVIFADEPTASLDSENRNAVLTLLKSAAMSGAIVLIATHDEWLMDKCDTKIILK